ncbi:MAG: hypothetical protein KatS3mg076_1542 [Candidatus Binatia bacterium]|nr:MAG: hypothetical protein KatS3mg076_1542 [Candidatus Binatia bacterium]
MKAPAVDRAFWADFSLALLVFVYLGSLVPYGFHLGEDGDVVYLVYRAFTGQVPYRDFGTGYTPGFFAAHAALFRLFGVDLVVLRWALAFVHSAAVFSLARLGRHVLPGPFVFLGPLAYVALMPVYRGEFAAFNVPYPAWYTVFTFAAGLLAMLRFFGTGRAGWALLGGLFAGLGTALKPNTGAFSLAAYALALLYAAPCRGRLLARAAWWLLLFGSVAGIAAVFGFRLTNRDARLLLWPVFALALLRAVFRARPLSRLDPPFVRGALALGAGFFLVTLAWAVPVFRMLGPSGFLRDVLFVGSGHALFFYLPIRELGVWDVGMALVAAGAVFLGRYVREFPRDRVFLLLVGLVLAATAGGVFLARAPMPEGLHRAVTKRLEYLAFGAALLVHWAGVLWCARTLRQRGARLSAESGEARSPERERELRWLASASLAVGAPVFYLSIWPRSDFFHWVLSAPVTVLLGTLFASRLAYRWFGPRRWALSLAALPLAAVVAFFAWPGVSTALRFRTARPEELAALGLRRASVLLEAGRKRRLENLAGLVRLVESESDEGETLLGFPNLHLVNFLSGRHVPGRYGSFHPGWPDHILEAEIVSSLEAAGTPLVALNHDQQLYMGHAPLYYFLLRTYVEREYRFFRSVGSYDLFLRKGREPRTELLRGPAPAVEVETERSCAEAVRLARRILPEDGRLLAPCWTEKDPALQEEAVTLLRQSRDPRGVLPLVEALAKGTLARRARLLAVRAAGELGDARSVGGLAAAENVVRGRVREELRSALLNIVLRSFIDTFSWRERGEALAAMRSDERAREAAEEWLGHLDPRLSLVAAWLGGQLGVREAEPHLRRLLETNDVVVQAMAADALFRLGVTDGVVERLLESLERDEMFVPPLVLRWARAKPEEAREKLTRSFTAGNVRRKETLCFVMAALSDAAFAPAFEAGTKVPDPRVRCACAWSAGFARVRELRGRLEELASGDSEEVVRKFARLGLGWLGPEGA